MMKRVFLLFLLMLLFCIQGTSNVPTSHAQTTLLDRAVQNIIDDMTPQQKVGQLMLITFDGVYLGQDADIVRLIQEYDIGNVMLTAENDNIYGRANTPQRVFSMITGLQRINYETSVNSGKPYLPLLVGTTHNGDGLPYTQVATGTTQLPSYMALGATWEPNFARISGSIIGEELFALGFNLLLGPSLDIQTNSGIDFLGVQTFGGEPFWVGQMGRAYIDGIHEGSQNQVLVVARSWPGLGASDRQLDQEVPVVPRSAEELRRFDLVPFFAVTDTDLGRVDGLQCANIRYQGENIRTETRPVCVDETAFRTVIEQPRYGDWRSEGVIISDSLGTRAMRRWYNVDPFPHRQVARDALLAGNDLLYLANFGTQIDGNTFENIADTVQFFAENYETDPVFAARVDEAVERIVRQKLTLYTTEPTLETVLPNPELLDNVGSQADRLFQVARNAVTLIAPQPSQLSPPPQADENIVFISDTRAVQQCSYCDSRPLIAVNALENAILNLYGAQGSGQIDADSISSYSLTRVQEYLTQPTVNSNPSVSFGIDLANDIQQADWIVFAILDDEPTVPSVHVVREFLAESTDLLLPQTRVVVMAFGAPYYLSSTDVSKLTAYYGLYGNGAPFIDTAARALFQEVPFTGAPPVSIPAVNYDLFEATSPDPQQTLRLNVSKLNSETDDLDGLQVGDTLVLRTEPILDRNGHIVPDGTQVTFTLSFVSEGVLTQQDASTFEGIGEASFVLRRAGQIEVRVASVEATSSVTFEITVDTDEVIATLQTIEPPTATPTPTITPSPTSTYTDTPTITPSPTSTYTDTPTITPSPTSTYTDTPTITPSPTSTYTDTPTITPSPTSTYTDTPTITPSPTSTYTDTPTITPSPTSTYTDTPTITPSPEDIETLVAVAPNTPPAVVPTPVERQLVSVSDFLLSLAGLILLVIPAVAAGWATSRSLDGTVRIVLGTVVAGLTGYVYYGAGAPGALLLRETLTDLAAMLITFLSGATGLIFTWWTVRDIRRD